MSKPLRNIILFSIVIISLFMHFRDFSKDLMSIHVWRQCQTHSTIINFFEEDMNIFNPRKNDRGDIEGFFRMEFPLMQWFVAGQYKIFGNHLIISRIFMFIIGLFSILGIYKLLHALFHNTTLAVFGAWAFNFSPSFYYYTINPLPDNFALCTSIWGMGLFFIWHNDKKKVNLILSGILLSIGALCKLPFTVYFIVPFLYFLRLFIRRENKLKIITQSFGVLGFSLLPIAWYLTVVPQWSENVIIKGMLDNTESTSKIAEYLQFNLISTLPELLLNYGSLLFFLAGFYFLYKKKLYRDSRFALLFGLSMAVLMYFLFEINAIEKIHDYYLFPFYPLLFILVGYGAYQLFISNIKFIRYMTVMLLLLLPLTCYLRMHLRWNPDSPGFNKDLLVYKTELRNAVPKNALVVAGNDESHFIFLYYIDKKGWGFDSDKITSQSLQVMIEKGAKYLYSDSREIDGNADIFKHFDQLILEKGSVRIYSLKNF